MVSPCCDILDSLFVGIATHYLRGYVYAFVLLPHQRGVNMFIILESRHLILYCDNLKFKVALLLYLTHASSSMSLLSIFFFNVSIFAYIVLNSSSQIFKCLMG
eukprot:526569_1